MIEHTEAKATISRKIEHPHQLTGSDLASAFLGEFDSNRDFAGRNHEHSPAARIAQAAVAPGPVFTDTIGETVQAGSDITSFRNTKLIEDQRCVSRRGGHSFQSVRRA